MNPNDPNVALLEVVANHLGAELLGELVFVGADLSLVHRRARRGCDADAQRHPRLLEPVVSAGDRHPPLRSFAGNRPRREQVLIAQ